MCERQRVFWAQKYFFTFLQWKSMAICRNISSLNKLHVICPCLGAGNFRQFWPCCILAYCTISIVPLLCRHRTLSHQHASCLPVPAQCCDRFINGLKLSHLSCHVLGWPMFSIVIGTICCQFMATMGRLCPCTRWWCLLWVITHPQLLELTLPMTNVRGSDADCRCGPITVGRLRRFLMSVGLLTAPGLYWAEMTHYFALTMN